MRSSLLFHDHEDDILRCVHHCNKQEMKIFKRKQEKMRKKQIIELKTQLKHCHVKIARLKAAAVISKNEELNKTS